MTMSLKPQEARAPSPGAVAAAATMPYLNLTTNLPDTSPNAAVRHDDMPSSTLQQASTAGPYAASPYGENDENLLPEDQHHFGIVPAGPDDEPDYDEFELTDCETGTSVTSSVYAHTYENGRRYQHFKNGRYPIPNDDEELNREDMKHAMLMELCDGRLFFAPIGNNVQKILDVGTGTGVWAIKVGNHFPNARVRSIDLSPT